MSARFLGIALVLLAASGCKDKRYTEVTLPKSFKPANASIALPDAFSETFPAGPGSQAMDNNCRTCHSPSMVLTQPPLKSEEWAKEIEKMVKVYKAPIPPADVPAIQAYLEAYSARQIASAKTAAPNAGPAAH